MSAGKRASPSAPSKGRVGAPAGSRLLLGAGLRDRVFRRAANSSPTAFRDANCSKGVLAIIFRQTASIRGSTFVRIWLGGVTGLVRIWPITAATEPRNGNWAVSCSYRITPRLYWSVGGPIFSGSPSTCFGDM
jgi:hypothetical protein